MKDRVYECKKEFELSEWDDDNNCFSDHIMTIEKDSVWDCTGSGYICDGEIHLEETSDTGNWIEISKEMIKEYFIDVTEKQQLNDSRAADGLTVVDNKKEQSWKDAMLSNFNRSK